MVYHLSVKASVPELKILPSVIIDSTNSTCKLVSTSAINRDPAFKGIEGQGCLKDYWKCFVCHSAPIREMQERCKLIRAKVKEEEEKETKGGKSKTYNAGRPFSSQLRIPDHIFIDPSKLEIILEKLQATSATFKVLLETIESDIKDIKLNASPVGDKSEAMRDECTRTLTTGIKVALESFQGALSTAYLKKSSPIKKNKQVKSKDDNLSQESNTSSKHLCNKLSKSKHKEGRKAEVDNEQEMLEKHKTEKKRKDSINKNENTHVPENENSAAQLELLEELARELRDLNGSQSDSDDDDDDDDDDEYDDDNLTEDKTEDNESVVEISLKDDSFKVNSEKCSIKNKLTEDKTGDDENVMEISVKDKSFNKVTSEKGKIKKEKPESELYLRMNNITSPITVDDSDNDAETKSELDRNVPGSLKSVERIKKEESDDSNEASSMDCIEIISCEKSDADISSLDDMDMNSSDEAEDEDISIYARNDKKNKNNSDEVQPSKTVDECALMGVEDTAELVEEAKMKSDNSESNDESSSTSSSDSETDIEEQRKRRRKKKADQSKKEKHRKSKREKKVEKSSADRSLSDDGDSKNKESSKITKKDEKLANGMKNEESDVSDLENEIDNLEENVQKQKPKKGGNVSEESDEESMNEAKKSLSKKKTTNKSKTKGKVTKNEDDDLSPLSNSEGEQEDDDEETESEGGTSSNKQITGAPNENDIAKKALIEDLEDSESKEDDDSSDSDSNDSDSETPKKKKKRTARGRRSKIKDSSEDSDESDSDPVPKKRIRSKLLDAKVSNSDDGSDSDVISRKKKGRGRKRKKKATSSESEPSDDDEENKNLGKKEKGTPKRRRIKNVRDSSDENIDKDDSKEADEDEDEDEDKIKDADRKNIRKVMSKKKLQDTTKAAAKAELERRRRIASKQREFNLVQITDENSPTKCPITTKLVLESDPEKDNKPILEVDHNLIKNLKPHQVEAVQFMWDCLFESMELMKKEEGGGCILAHCMGLGKTLSVITLLHTVMVARKKTGVKTCLVICPLNTVLNWQNEFEIWQENTEKEVQVWELSGQKTNEVRARILQNWMDEGGVMIIGYEMHRNLSTGSRISKKRLKKIFHEMLVDPGPDMVVCDEGHLLKNSESGLSKAVNSMKTRRRVVLTGTPLQNNLLEYHCMVSFVKPALMGTVKEFRNRFVNPITNGQCSDSTAWDVKLMKRRAHVLHEMLNGCVQRRDYSALTKFLPPKFEYVITVRLAKVQMDLYDKYLDTILGEGRGTGAKGTRLFADYQMLMRIWTHPWILKLDEIRQESKMKYDDSEDSFIDDSEDDTSESSESSSSSSSEDSFVSDASDKNSKRKKKQKPENSSEVVNKWKTRSRGGNDPDVKLEDFEIKEEATNTLSSEWWAEFFTEEDHYKVELGGKLVVLFEILRVCEEIGDKVLIFSQSLLSLDMIEDFLAHLDEERDKEMQNSMEKEETDEDAPIKSTFGNTWNKGADYFRLDGSTSALARKSSADSFNDPENFRARLFLISTRAGSLGINLIAANRVIIFDASWNPSHDIQSIFRTYRFGQEKPVYIYRFLAQGTMEEKIYERQVTKQSLSQRVVDEHQIDRHFSQQDLQELYRFTPDRLDDPDRPEKPTPILPKDTLLAELLKSHKDWIVGYHEHDSLLENKIDEGLSEEDRKAAWEEFENEKKQINRAVFNMPNQMANVGVGAGGMPNPSMVKVVYPQLNSLSSLAQAGGMINPNMVNNSSILHIVQEVKHRFPNMSPEQFQLTVQGVLRQQMSQQIRMQEELRRRQMEQRQFQEFQRLQHLQNQLKLQESQSKPTDSSAGSQGSMLSKLMATSDASKLVKVVQPPQPSSVTTNPQSNTVKVIRPEQKGFMGNYITNSLLKKNASQPQKVNQSQPSAAISNVIDLSVDDNSPVKKVVVKNAEKIGTKDSPKAQKEKNLIEEKKSEPDVFEPSQRGRTRKKINYLEK